MSTGISTRTAPGIKLTQIRLLVPMRKASRKSQANANKDEKTQQSVNPPTRPLATTLDSWIPSQRIQCRKIQISQNHLSEPTRTTPRLITTTRTKSLLKQSTHQISKKLNPIHPSHNIRKQMCLWTKKWETSKKESWTW